jgi:hypothetical protein
MATKEPETAPTLTIETPVELKQVAYLLCCALEGGSNYWYRIEDAVAPTTPAAHMGGEVYRHIDWPLCEGGALLISDRMAAREPRTERLDLAAIRRGLALMAREHPRHFGNWRADRYDAETGDVFLQCCLYGQVIYG